MIGPFFDPSWIVENADEILSRTWEHLTLTFLAVSAGLLIAFPAAVLVHRYRRAYAPTVAVAGVLYTIPSLALFAFLVPFTGLTTLTAEIGLVSYTLLILIRNIAAGLAGVPADTKEAAIGMGYTPKQLLLKVELPLAMPAMIAGIRLATVTTIGLVTVTALIGQGGLGYLILTLGLDRFYSTAILVGGGLSVALAVLADRLLLVIEQRATPWSRRWAPRAQAT